MPKGGVIFVGPSLDAHEIRASHPDLDIRSPAGRGDVLSVLAWRQPAAIGLIDGFFSQRPAVWHKELLYAMEQGVAVFGGASMGALRAAELEPYGMKPIGRIAMAFLRGELEDDDEVAVVHAPKEFGFTPLSLAMVDIRATLDRLTKDGILPAALSSEATATMKALPYWERTKKRLLEALRRHGWKGTQPELGEFPISVKRKDAEQVVEAVAQATSRPQDVRETPGARVVRTDMFAELLRTVPVAGAETAIPGLVTALRADPIRYRILRDRAVIRGIAAAEAFANGVDANPADVSRTVEALVARGVGRRLRRIAGTPEPLARRIVLGNLADRLPRALVERWIVEEMCLEGTFEEYLNAARRLDGSATPTGIRVDSSYWGPHIKAYERNADWLDLDPGEFRSLLEP